MNITITQEVYDNLLSTIKNNQCLGRDCARQVNAELRRALVSSENDQLVFRAVELFACAGDEVLTDKNSVELVLYATDWNTCRLMQTVYKTLEPEDGRLSNFAFK